MRLALPVLDDIVSEYVLHLIADLDLCSITIQFGHGPPSPDVILEDIDKLLVCLHWVDITYHRLSANKELCCGYSTVNCQSVQVYCVCCYWLITAMDVTC